MLRSLVNDTDLTQAPEFYYGKKHWASNMYRSLFVYEGVAFLWVEQAFQWAKAMIFGDFKTALAILRVDNPFDAKRLGRKCAGFNEKKWLRYRDKIMENVVYCKFTCNRELYYKLMSSSLLIEESPTDSYWGTGCSREETITAIKTAKIKSDMSKSQCLHFVHELRIGKMADIYMSLKRRVSILALYENYMDKIGYALASKEITANVRVHQMQINGSCEPSERNWSMIHQNHNCKKVSTKSVVECYKPPKYLSDAITDGGIYVVNESASLRVHDITYALLGASSIVLPWHYVNVNLECITEEMKRAGTESNFESYIEMTSPRS